MSQGDNVPSETTMPFSDKTDAQKWADIYNKACGFALYSVVWIGQMMVQLEDVEVHGWYLINRENKKYYI